MPSLKSQQIRATFVNDRETLDVPLDVQRREWEAGAAQVQLPPDISIAPVDAGGVFAERVSSPATVPRQWRAGIADQLSASAGASVSGGRRRCCGGIPVAARTGDPAGADRDRRRFVGRRLSGGNNALLARASDCLTGGVRLFWPVRTQAIKLPYALAVWGEPSITVISLITGLLLLR
jgi:hypothetical protein